jgi:hypothetical protein
LRRRTSRFDKRVHDDDDDAMTALRHARDCGPTCRSRALLPQKSPEKGEKIRLMSSPFSFASPHIPQVPHSTPIRRPPRPPLVNPYDKFSQTEFDDWISTITGTLRKALGHESDEPDRRESASPFNEIHAHPTHHSSTDEEDEEYDSDADGPNDSLADIRTRFIARLDKGKARDSMEGPGLAILAKGDRSAPIEIDLDDDDSGPETGPILPESSILEDEDDLDDQEVAQHLSF